MKTQMFTIFRESSKSLLYIIGIYFDSVIVCKPTMSTPGNGEVYIVARGFRGIEASCLEALLRHTRFWGTDCITKLMICNTEWTQSIENIAALFASIQRAVIERNLFLFENPEITNEIDKKTVLEQATISHCREEIADKWMKIFKLKSLKPGQNLINDPLTMSRINHRNTNGSLGQRVDARNVDTGVIRDGTAEDAMTALTSKFGNMLTGKKNASGPQPSTNRGVMPYQLTKPAIVSHYILAKDPVPQKDKGLSGMFVLGTKHYQVNDMHTIIDLWHIQSTDIIQQNMLKLYEKNRDSYITSNVVTGRAITAINGSQFIDMDSLRDYNINRIKGKKTGKSASRDEIKHCIRQIFGLHDEQFIIHVFDHQVDELDDRNAFADDLKITLDRLTPGTCYVRQVTPCFTRMTAGLYYLLTMCFKSIDVFHVPGQGVFLICLDFCRKNTIDSLNSESHTSLTRNQNLLCDFVRKTLSAVVIYIETAHQDSDVLEVVDSSCFEQDKLFVRTLTNMNKEYLKTQLNGHRTTNPGIPYIGN